MRPSIRTLLLVSVLITTGCGERAVTGGAEPPLVPRTPATSATAPPSTAPVTTDEPVGSDTDTGVGSPGDETDPGAGAIAGNGAGTGAGSPRGAAAPAGTGGSAGGTSHTTNQGGPHSPSTGGGPKPATTAPSSHDSGSGAGQPNPCGKVPPGTAADLRTLQKIYFPPLGTEHQWPDTAVTPKACATSGLAVTYAWAGGDGTGRCFAYTDQKPVKAQSIPMACKVTAGQQGDARFAPAEPVTVDWAVNQLSITIRVVTDGDLEYNADDPVVPVTGRLTAAHSIPRLPLYVQTDGNCAGPHPYPFTEEGRGSDYTMTVDVTLTDPGEQPGSCALKVIVDANAVAHGAHDDRTYVVVRAKSGG